MFDDSLHSIDYSRGPGLLESSRWSQCRDVDCTTPQYRVSLVIPPPFDLFRSRSPLDAAQVDLGLLLPESRRRRESHICPRSVTRETESSRESSPFLPPDFPLSLELNPRMIRTHEQVIVITHAYPPRCGVRWLPNGIKVYYIPVQPLPPTHVHATLPNFFTALPYLRSIYLREQIDIVHAHASLSALGMEGIMHARTMGIRTVFTDHSLFGLGNMAEIWGNKMLKGCLSDVEAVICVSHTG